MKNIYRLFTAALVLLGAAACNPSEINNPDNSNQKGKSEITITASIIQTRVSYDCSNLREVKQSWEDGDIVFGFHSGSTSVSNRIAFRVSAVNSETGEASLVAVSGADWIETDEESGRVVDLVYTGTDASYNTSGGIDVDLSQQTLDRVRGCMHAHAALQIDDEGNKTLEFYFQNDCALIEIDGLPGAVEDWEFISSGQHVTSVGISQISIPNLYLKGSYSYNGSLSFATSNFDPEECVITLELNPTEWSINNQGFINGPNDFQGYPQKILIAVAPYLEELPFLVTATIPSLGEVPDIEYDYDYKQLEKGNCYVISPQPVVARTADGQYFTSVSGAFDHAKQLKDTYTSEETNIVTLVQDCGLAGVKKQDGTYTSNVGGSNPLLINGYDVTLDLNGHVLSLAGENDFFGVNRKTDDSKYSDTLNKFIITDSKGKNADGKYDGKIYYLSDDKEEYSSDGEHIIRNSGSVQIDGGTLWNNDDWCAVRNYPGAVLTVNDGELYSDSWRTIHDEGSIVIITNGKVSSRTNSAIYSYEGTVNITGGVISNASELYEAIQIYGGAQCTISGGVIFSENASTVFCGSVDKGDDASDASALTITWPEKRNNEGEIIGYDQTSGETNHEPLIYSKSSMYYSIAPITTFYRDEIDMQTYEEIKRINTAQVLIQGGYLFTHSPEGIIYVDDDVDTDDFTNLQFSSCGKFYANAYVIDIYANSYNKNYFKDLYPSYTYGTITLSATSQTDVYSPNFVSGLPIETSLYYIE